MHSRTASAVDGVLSGTLNGIRQGAELLHRAHSPVNDSGAAFSPGLLANKIDDLEQVIRNGPPARLSDLPTYIDAVKNLKGVGVNDRKFLLEKLVTLMSRLPEGSQFATRLSRHLIDTLYKDLPHPPASYCSQYDLPPPPLLASFTNGKPAKYAFRTYDGSHYNPLFPSMGRAGTPYARSVPSLARVPTRSLPEPGLVFDTLLKRDMYERHPGDVSSLFFAFANLVIHSIFDTSHSDQTINGSSAYLDLSPLYGGGTGIQARPVECVRRLDGTGRLWDDVFADQRLLLMPPASAALLVLLNRNHNYIASKILDINEFGTYENPPPKDGDACRDQDDEIYHRARMVNCGFFMQIILRDYVGAILGLARDGHSWRLDPLETMRDSSHSWAPQGEGNVCSIEFNMLYRWHATTSERDAMWTEQLFRRYSDKPFNQMTHVDFKQMAHNSVRDLSEDPRDWTFGGLHRQGPDKRFADADLARIIQDATEAPAASFKARGTPAYMRVIEIMGIEQGRAQGICNLNEFRKFMGLRPYASFKEWNPKEEIWRAAEALYGEIDNLELHVGLQAEEAKKPMPGAGLCPGYTISRAILADAVALVRGDRFLTTEFTPHNLTSWGYQDTLADTKDGAYGGILTKLLFRTLPEYYPARSAYAHFPFMVPELMEGIMQDRHDPHTDKYIWSRPPVPEVPIVAASYDAVQQCLEAREKFSSGADIRLASICGETPVDRTLVNSVLLSKEWTPVWQTKLTEVAARLLRERRIGHVGKEGRYYVDVVQHVINLLPVHLIADNIVGLPLKSNTNAHGVYREEELYDMFATIGNYIMLNLQREDDWHLRESSAAYADVIINYTKDHIARLSRGLLSVAGVRDQFNRLYARNDCSDDFLRELVSAADGEREPEELASSVLAEVVGTAALYSSAIAHVVEFYLDDARARERADISALAHVHNYDADEKLARYIREALRLNPPVSAVFRTAKDDGIVDGKAVKPGQRVVASIESANLDRKAVGSEPQEASYAREPKKLGLYCLGGHGMLNPAFFEKTAPHVLRAIFRLRNVSRAHGASGLLNSFSQDLHGVRQRQYIDGRGKVTPFPASLIIQYDDV